VARSEVMNFCIQVVATKKAKETPIINLDGVSFIHTTYNDVTLIATTRANINAAMIVQFLYNFIQLCKAYFKEDFKESEIRQNFSLIYELLDEVLDHGYPQIMDPELLKQYITGGKVAERKDIDIQKLK